MLSTLADQVAQARVLRWDVRCPRYEGPLPWPMWAARTNRLLCSPASRWGLWVCVGRQRNTWRRGTAWSPPDRARV